MSNYTPGPWIAEEEEPYYLTVRGGHRIAEVYLDDAPVDDYNRVQRANARLIAAAPDLLELLRLAFAGFVELHGQGIGCPDCPSDEDTRDPQKCPAVMRMDETITRAESR